MSATAEKELIESPLKPLGKRVVILPDQPEKQSRGGILIPDKAQQKTSRGTVLAVGRDVGRSGEEMSIQDHEDSCAEKLKRGDRVVYGSWSGNEIVIDGVEVKVVKDEDILGVL